MQTKYGGRGLVPLPLCFYEEDESMKISQMTNDQAADAMIKLAQPMSNLLEDEATVGLLKEMEKGDSKGGIAFFGRMLPKIVAFAMKDHKEDVYAIVAALTMKPVAEVGSLNFMETVKEMKESIDDEFIGFFTSSGNVTSKPGIE